jgi:hypothetical protein
MHLSRQQPPGYYITYRSLNAIAQHDARHDTTRYDMRTTYDTIQDNQYGI